jgi:hypothetical protein
LCPTIVKLPQRVFSDRVNSGGVVPVCLARGHRREGFLGRLPTGVQSSAMTNFTSVLSQLQQERNRLAAQLESINGAISALNGVTSNETGRKTISATGRARISAAQRARWAKLKGPKVVSIAAHKQRKMSLAARRKIAAAQRLRWAKWKRAQKKG